MSREEDRKLCEWAGWTTNAQADADPVWIRFKDTTGRFGLTLPYYTTKDEDVIQLLPVLVERGLSPILEYEDDINLWSCAIFKRGEWNRAFVIADCSESTICKAITSAILQLIEKEGK